MRREQFTVNELIVNSINGFPFPGGIGMGRTSYLVPATSSTSGYRAWLLKNGVSPQDMYLTLAAAYADATAYRNDTIFAFPGNYLATAEQNLDKADVHIVGVTGNVDNDYGYGGASFYTTGVGVARVFDVTAPRAQFHNIRVANHGANAACLQAVFLRGPSTVWKNCAIQGHMTSEQQGEALSSSLTIDRGGDSPHFEDCVFGNYNWGVRAAANAVLYFKNGEAGVPMDGGVFKRCRFLSETANVTYAMVKTQLKSVTRMWLFEDCVFYNFCDATGAFLNQVFHDADTFYTHQFVLKRCTAVGFDEWQDSDIGFKSVMSDMPIVGLGGGLATQPTAITGS